MAGMRGIPAALGSRLRRSARSVMARRLLPPGPAHWLVVRLGPATGEERASPLRMAMGASRNRPPTLSLLEVLFALERAAQDPRVEGVILRFHGSLPGWSKALALQRAVRQLREAGKRVVAWGEALGAEEYLVASAAERIWLPESGSLFLVGLRTDHFSLRGLLDHLEVRADVVRVGDYKSAGETLTRKSISDAQREQMGAWLDDLYEEWTAQIAAGRGLEAAALRTCIDEGPYPARLAAEVGLIDATLYPDEIDDALAELSGREGEASREVNRVGVQDYLNLVAADRGAVPLTGELPRIAYVVASGSIHRGDASRGVASDAFGALFEEIGEQPEVRAVVLRVDSPGGDAVASDLLYRSLRRLRESKPVVVSMGDVAASGGYFLAAAADQVFAEVATLTGSIGVVGGKLDFEGLYRKLGIGRESLERGARAGLLSEYRAFSPDERGALRREMAAVYETFLARVCEGRGLSREAVAPLAGGRVWSGSAARERGLVDGIGGPLEALGAARERAGISVGSPFAVDHYPRRGPLLDWRAVLGALLGPR